MTTRSISFTPAKRSDARGFERVEIFTETQGIITPGVTERIVLHNISNTGVLIEADSLLSIGQSLQLAVPDVGQVMASVVWCSDSLYGCRFVEPLPDFAMKAAQMHNPMAAEFASAPQAAQVNELAQRLRRLREERGLSLAALSRRAGISKPSIWAWETGKTTPRPRSIHTLAKALGVSPALILGHDTAADAATDGQGSTSLGDFTKAVDAARSAIAAAAGVAPSQVRISIDY